MKLIKTLLLTISTICLMLSAAFAETNSQSKASTSKAKPQKATFAGGCFWCMEPPFEKVKGVISVTSGFIGGTSKNPTYKDVASGKTNHKEAVEIIYNPKLVSYENLIEIFWKQVDPLDAGGQFVDRGAHYTTGVFYHDQNQKKIALKSKNNLEKSKKLKGKIVTKITKATTFYLAEDYHQDYYKKNPVRYKLYRYGSGRDKRLKELWGK